MSLNANNTKLKFETFDYGGFLEWFPNDTENKYYGLGIAQNKLYIVYFDRTASPAIDYNKPIATEEYVTNQIQGAINTAY